MGDDDQNARMADFRARALFYAIRQVDGEPVSDWYKRVRSAAATCRFPSADGPVADKFVIGLRPGPVADRLLAERADARPEDVLALAMETAERAKGATSNEPGSTKVLDEIREGLKWYRYSTESFVAAGHAKNDQKLKNNTCIDKKLNGYVELMLNEKAWKENKIEGKTKQYKNPIKNEMSLTNKDCCNLKTKLLKCFEEKNPILNRLNTDKNNYEFRHHDESKCYCSWLTNSECESKDLTKASKSERYISMYEDRTQTSEFCVCNSD